MVKVIGRVTKAVKKILEKIKSIFSRKKKDYVPLNAEENLRYIERDGLESAFWDVYDSIDENRNNRYVINYYGPVGMGKSRLCQHLKDALCSNNEGKIAKSIILNLKNLKNNCDKVNILEHLVNKFEKEYGYDFLLFKYGLHVYYNKIGETNSSPEIKRIQDRPEVAAGLELGALVPQAASAVGIFKAVDSARAFHNEQELKNNKSIKNLEKMHEDDIPNELVKIFIAQLSEHTQKEENPVVIFLDMYEKLQNYASLTFAASDDWLYSENGLIQNVPNVIWILAGRRKITWGEEESKERGINIVCKCIEIEKIKNEKIIRERFEKIGIDDDEILDVIVKNAKGIPKNVASFWERAYYLIGNNMSPKISDFEFDMDKDFESFVRQYAGDLDFVSRDVLDTLACLESWSERELVDLRISAYAYEHILHSSFINYDDGIYSIHDYIQVPLYKGCAKLIQNQILRYFGEKARDVSVTISDRQDYVYKKIKLQFFVFGTSLDLKENDIYIMEKVNFIIEESLTYIRQYLYDYNFFLRVKGLIFEDNSDISNKYVESILQKKFEIYDCYYCVDRGDYNKIKYYLDKNIDVNISKLDGDTKGFLYVSLGSYWNQMNQMKGYEKARNYFKEASDLWEKSDDIYTWLDLAAKLGKVYINLKEYSKAIERSEYAINKAKDKLKTDKSEGDKFKKVDNIKLDPKSVVSYCELLVNKAEAERLQGNLNNTLKYLSQAEAALKQFEDLGNGGIFYAKTRIYQQYAFVYEEYVWETVDGEDLRKKYAQKAFESAQKAAELVPSFTNQRILAIACNQWAKAAPMAERKEVFDKSIESMKAFYEKQPNENTYKEMFKFIREAADFVSGDIRNEYIDRCKKLLEKGSEFEIDWDEHYTFCKTELSHYIDIGEYDISLEKVEYLESMFEEHKDSLPPKDYLAYRSWIFRAKGKICEEQRELDQAIKYYRMQYDIENELYKTELYKAKSYDKYTCSEYADGMSYSDSCIALASVYMKLNDFDSAETYAQYQREVVNEQKVSEARFWKRRIVQLYIKSLSILRDCYEQKQNKAEALKRYEEPEELRNKILEICNEELIYMKMLYRNERTADWLNECTYMLGELTGYNDKENWDEFTNGMYASLMSTLGKIQYMQSQLADEG